jgi:CHRD domain
MLFNNESSQLTYLVNVTGLDKISQSGIHNGIRGINGDLVIPLKDNETADNSGIASILFQDDMNEDDLQGPLFGKGIPDLVKLMSNESDARP